MSTKKYIGIVGGVGPYAGLELQKAILRKTPARCDQDHLPVLVISAPHDIHDRTEFLLGTTPVNPGYEIVEQATTLYAAGARFIGIPCNTAHAGRIFSVVESGIRDLRDCVLVNMIDQTFLEIRERLPDVRRIGVIATKGSYRHNIFGDYGERHRIEVIIPDTVELQETVHRSIYDATFGIKALGYLHDRSRGMLDDAFAFYDRNGVTTIVLGCTELSVVRDTIDPRGFNLIDPIDLLAGKLISLYRSHTER
jgi:aspartate racemase